MIEKLQFVAGLACAALAVSACSNTERTSPGTAGASGGESAGSTAFGGSSSGDAAIAGQENTAGSASGTGAAGSSAGGGSSSSGTAGAATAAAGGEAGATGTQPLPMLVNPSFELGGLAGWQVTVTPPKIGKAIFAQWGSPTGVSIDGMYEVSFWNGTSGFKGDIHQTLTGLTPGTYELKAYVAYGISLNAAYLYAIGCGPTDSRTDLPLAAGEPTFAPFSIPSIEVTGDSCTVGLFADMNTGDWLNADAFVFDLAP